MKPETVPIGVGNHFRWKPVAAIANLVSARRSLIVSKLKDKIPARNGKFASGLSSSLRQRAAKTAPADIRQTVAQTTNLATFELKAALILHVAKGTTQGVPLAVGKRSIGK
jgi:hypothetical protein